MADACLTAIGVQTTAVAVGAHYGAGLLDGWLVDDQDKEAAADPALAGIEVRALPLYMRDLASTAAIARAALDLAAELCVVTAPDDHGPGRHRAARGRRGRGPGALIADAVRPTCATATSWSSPRRSSARPRAAWSSQDREAAIDAETVRVRGPARRRADRGDPARARARRRRGGRLQHRRRAPWCCCPRTRTSPPGGCARRCATGPGPGSASSSPTRWAGPGGLGQTDTAIGAAGVLALRDHRGAEDSLRQHARGHGGRGRRRGRRRRRPGQAQGPADPGGGRARAWPTWSPTRTARARRADPQRGRGHVPARRGRRAAARRRTVRDFTGGPVAPRRCAGPSPPHSPRPAPHHSSPGGSWCWSRPAPGTALLDAMLEAWIADLRGDGFTEEQIARRVRRGEPLRRAPLIVVPCLVADGGARLPRRPAQRLRAGDVRGLHGRGRARTCWSRWPSKTWARAGSPAPCSARTSRRRHWASRPVASRWAPIGVGHPAAPPPERPPATPPTSP